ncbi:MAG: class I SAM-dependent methyltransferase [Actinomycetota bacterium]|nr:class I SAM-dependent methyltransferase [Actinomycetota bacterium]
MATLDKEEFALHLPESGSGLDQDQEWIEIEIGDERRRIRLHDYAEIYNVPGLYEQLFAEQLDCDSPRVVCGLLGEQLDQAGVDAAKLTALDFGAGNGMVAEQLAELGVGEIVGVDLLEEARVAAKRDRPALYEDYYALDLTELEPDQREDLTEHNFNALTCVAALGFGDVPPVAFAEAFNFVASPGWIAFNLRDRFFEERDPSGFGGFMKRMFDEGVVEERARVRYRHRVSVEGEPLHYLAVIAEKRDDVPMAWATPA